MKSFFTRIIQFVCLLGGITFAIGESITGTFLVNESDVTYSDEAGYVKVSLNHENEAQSKDLGAPALPKVVLTSVIPVNATNVGLTITDVEYRSIKSSVLPYPVQEDYFSGETVVFTALDQQYYNGIYPASSGEFGSVGIMRGTKLATFSLHVLRYNGQNSSIEIADKISYEITYDLLPGGSAGGYTYSNIFANTLQQMVVNPEKLKSWSTVSNPYNRSSGEQIDFLIITSKKLESAFNSYAAFRAQERYLTTRVVTLEDILLQYEGETRMVQLKQCIKDYVENKNTIYVLLGGDIGEIGCQKVWDESHVPYEIASDLFFSCIDKELSWNKDGDNKIGEKGEDAPDIYPDVMLGRLPVNSPQEVYEYIGKINKFKNGSANKNRRNKMFMSIGGSDPKNPAEFADNEKSIKIHTEKIFPRYWKNAELNWSNLLGTSQFVNTWNQGYNAIYLAMHGLEDLLLLKGWAANAPETEYFTKNDVENLTTVSNIVYGTSCRSAAFDYPTQSLGEKLVLYKDGGTLNYIGASRVATHCTSQKYCEIFAKYLTNSSLYNFNSIGNALLNTQMKFAIHDTKIFHWDLYVKTLLGDPTILFYEKEDQSSIEELIRPNGDNIELATVAKNDDVYAVTKSSPQKCFTFDASGMWQELPALTNKTIINIAVDSENRLWATTSDSEVYRLSGSGWDRMPGSGWDIAVGMNGEICLLASDAVYRWSGSDWVSLEWHHDVNWHPNYTVLDIGVDAEGRAWVVTPNREIYYHTEQGWEMAPGRANLIISLEDGRIAIDDLNIWNGIEWLQHERCSDLEGYVQLVGSSNKRYLYLKDDLLYWVHEAENITYMGHLTHNDHWKLWGDENVLTAHYGEYSYEVRDEPKSNKLAVKLSVSNGGGSELWSALFAQELPAAITKGEKYRVSFWAKQESVVGDNGEILVTVSMKESPWTEYGALTLQLSEEYKRYEFEFTMEEDTDKDAIMQFCIGKHNRVVYIDNIRLDRISPLYEHPETPKIKYALYNEDHYEIAWYPVKYGNVESYTVYNNNKFRYNISDTIIRYVPGEVVKESKLTLYPQIQAIDKYGSGSLCQGINGFYDAAQYLVLDGAEDRYVPLIQPDFYSGDGFINISWEAAGVNEDLEKYVVSFSELDEFRNIVGPTRQAETMNNAITINGLKKNTLYNITVKALLNNAENAKSRVYIRTGIGSIIPPSSQYPEWSNSTTYWGGDKVSYNGKEWEAQWWTLGDVPGSASVWVEIRD